MRAGQLLLDLPDHRQGVMDGKGVVKLDEFITVDVFCIRIKYCVAQLDDGHAVDSVDAVADDAVMPDELRMHHRHLDDARGPASAQDARQQRYTYYII